MIQPDDDNSSISKRQLLKVIGSAGALSVTANGALASSANQEEDDNGDHPGSGPGRDGRGRGEYPQIPDDEVPDVPLSNYATQVAFHPNHDRAVFSTAALGGGFNLYHAQGVESPDSSAESIRQITDSDELELAPELSQNNLLRYDQGYVRYERELPPSNRVFEPTVIQDPSFEGVNSL